MGDEHNLICDHNTTSDDEKEPTQTAVSPDGNLDVKGYKLLTKGN